MLNIVDDNLVVESKGIYSIEKFLIARRLMYWQVYFHKTVVCSEQMLIQILKRAKELSKKQIPLFTTKALKSFLENNYKLQVNGTFISSYSIIGMIGPNCSS